MIPRARRVPATLPARRGMRAAWFRGRQARLPGPDDRTTPDRASAGVESAAAAVPGTAGETAGTSEPTPAPPGGETRAVAGSATREEPARRLVATRPGYGHPTF